MEVVEDRAAGVLQSMGLKESPRLRDWTTTEKYLKHTTLEGSLLGQDACQPWMVVANAGFSDFPGGPFIKTLLPSVWSLV